MKPATGKHLLLVLLVLCLTCTSRYRLNLYLVVDGVDKKVKVETTEYVQGATIADPFAEDKLTAGDGNCIILSLGRRGEKQEVGSYSFMGYDEYLRCLLYLQLPLKPEADTINLQRNSFVQFMGRYDVPAEEKIFLPESGTLVVDSLVDKRLYGTVDGAYTNKQGQEVGFTGRFKVKIAR